MAKKEIQPYYTNKAQLKAEENQHRRNLTLVQQAFNLFEEKAGHTISSYDEFKRIVDDPCKYFCDLKMSQSEEATFKLKQLIGDLIAFERLIENTIEYPQGFYEAERACKRIRDEKINLDFFTLRDGSIQLADSFYTRQIGRTIFYANTPLKQKRLAYAQKVVALLNEQAELLKAEAEENGRGKRVDSVLQKFDFVGPLPYCVRAEIKGLASDGWTATKELIVNEKFVEFGHSQFITEVAPTKEPRPEKAPEKYRVCLVPRMDGGKEQVLIHPGDPVPFDSMRSKKTTLLPHTYVIESGKLKSVGKGEKYPEHHLLHQPEK